MHHNTEEKVKKKKMITIEGNVSFSAEFVSKTKDKDYNLHNLIFNQNNISLKTKNLFLNDIIEKFLFNLSTKHILNNDAKSCINCKNIETNNCLNCVRLESLLQIPIKEDLWEVS